MEQLDQISEEIRHYFEEVNTARDQAYQRSRELVSICSRAIRAVHRAWGLSWHSVFQLPVAFSLHQRLWPWPLYGLHPGPF